LSAGSASQHAELAFPLSKLYLENSPDELLWSSHRVGYKEIDVDRIEPYEDIGDLQIGDTFTCNSNRGLGFLVSMGYLDVSDRETEVYLSWDLPHLQKRAKNPVYIFTVLESVTRDQLSNVGLVEYGVSTFKESKDLKRAVVYEDLDEPDSSKRFKTSAGVFSFWNFPP